MINYETTWYPGNQAAYKMVQQGQIGELRKIVVHDGHNGPKEIGCSTNFLNWLTDPALNGGGAIVDFGCYGADLITWLMNGQKPTSVLAITQQIKPELYPKVDDEATIVLTYPKAQGIIQVLELAIQSQGYGNLWSHGLRFSAKRRRPCSPQGKGGKGSQRDSPTADWPRCRPSFIPRGGNTR